MTQEALKMALEALEFFKELSLSMKEIERAEEAITAIKEALAQPQQEPHFSVQQAYAMAQVCLDLHEALGCKWGDNPYLAIAGLQEAQPQQESVAGMVLVPYEPCFEMQEQGSMASDYDLSQSRAKRVYQAMIDMHQVLEEKEPSDEWFQLNAGYTPPPQRKPLTDEEIMELLMPVRIFGDGYYLRIARAIEAKLKEKNDQP